MEADDPAMWLYLSVAVILVLLGGVFAGLTIALMGQVCSRSYRTLPDLAMAVLIWPVGRDLLAGHQRLWGRIGTKTCCERFELA